MTNGQVRLYADPVLRTAAERVRCLDEEVCRLAEEMHEIMRSGGGVGLAAPQIGVLKRIIAVDLRPAGLETEPFALVNPVIITSSGEDVLSEGCLSLPGISADVRRAADVTVQGVDPVTGRCVELSATMFAARVLQHEIDHLDGILFIDRIPKDVRVKIQPELELLRARSG